MSGPQATIGEEVKAAAEDLVHRLATALSARAYSPRIRLLNLDQVKDATGLGKTTIYEMVAAGTFPKPQDEPKGKNLWRESAIIAWCDAHDPNIRGNH